MKTTFRAVERLYVCCIVAPIHVKPIQLLLQNRLAGPVLYASHDVIAVSTLSPNPS
jgi:hypothetical protein